MLTRRELVALVLAFVVTLPAVTTRIYASDEVQYFAWLRSVVFDRDIDFDNEYRHFYESGVAQGASFYETFLGERLNENDRRINFGPIGCAVLWAPFYAAGHVVALVTDAPTDGFSQPYISAVTYGSAVYGFLGVLLTASIVRRLLGHGLGASLVILAGTPLLFYIYVTPPFAHANSAFAVSLFLWLWLRAREHWSARDVVLLGLAGGVMSMVREQDLFFVAGPAIDFARWAWTTRSSIAIRTAIIGVGSFAVAFIPQLIAYQALNGHFGPTELSTRKMTWTSPHALGVLFSPEHGLFAWTPLLLIALGGLVWLAVRQPPTPQAPDVKQPPTPQARDVRWIAQLALVMFAFQIYVSGSVESWTVAGAFGQRRFVADTPLFALGLAAVMLAARSTSAGRRVLIAALVLGVWWNLGLMAQFGTNRMDRQRLSLLDNARTTFLELPIEAPGLAWRYLTNRSSFYQQPSR
jgi:hypothetical protein